MSLKLRESETAEMPIESFLLLVKDDFHISEILSSLFLFFLI